MYMFSDIVEYFDFSTLSVGSVPAQDGSRLSTNIPGSGVLVDACAAPLGDGSRAILAGGTKNNAASNAARLFNADTRYIELAIPNLSMAPMTFLLLDHAGRSPICRK